MMTKMGAKLAEQSDQIAELTAQVAALSIKPEKQEKPEKPVTTFAGLYGALMLNADGSGKRFRHIAELKNGEDDEWFATWDAKNSVLAQEDCDAVHESFSAFGSAHYKSLGEQLKKLSKHDSYGGWEKVKFYDTTKKKFIAASTLRADKPRAVSRAKSAGRRRSDAGKAKTPVPRRRAVADGTLFHFKHDDGNTHVFGSAGAVDILADDYLGSAEKDFYDDNKADVFAALCEWNQENPETMVDAAVFQSVVAQLLDN
jgi:hypothetical protein